MSLIEKEPSIEERERAEVLRNSALPAVEADEFRYFVDEHKPSFTAYFPLVEPVGRTGREYFLALAGIERPLGAMNEDGTPKVNEDGSPNFLWANEKVYLEELHVTDGQDVIGVSYTGIRV